jgi:hypothetical protein
VGVNSNQSNKNRNTPTAVDLPTAISLQFHSVPSSMSSSPALTETFQARRARSPEMENPTTSEGSVHDDAIVLDGTINPQHDRNDKEFKEVVSEEYKPSWLECAELVVLCAASIAMISTSLGIEKVVLHIDNISRFTQFKGSVIAIVATIMHALIGNLVSGSS